MRDGAHFGDLGEWYDLMPPPVGHMLGERGEVGDIGAILGEPGGEDAPRRGERGAPLLSFLAYSSLPTRTSCRSKTRLACGGTNMLPRSSWRPPLR